jgi:endonuclease/exonuclease/phosphatase family metal-dependent hydrolase
MLAVYGEGEEELAVVISHLSLGSGARQRQFDFIGDLIAPFRHAVVMGDFNCQPTSPGFRRFLDDTGLRVPGAAALPTYPAWKPQRSIDHILLSESLQALRYEVPDIRLSDHLPIVVDVALPERLRLRG